MQLRLGWGGRVSRAEVNLDAIAANVQELRHAAGSADLMAVVKGNGYGHGAVPVATTALAHGARWIGVYTVEEGIELRRAFISAPILVFGPFQPEEADDICEAGLTPTVTTMDAAAWLQRSTAGRTMSFHLKIDTGLTRAGIGPAGAVAFMERLRHFPALHAEGLYTHFASAEDPSKDLSRKQLQTFLQVSDALTRAGFTFAIKHAANSAATLELPESHLDLVRTGISLYGYYPSPDMRRAVSLRPALSLVSAVTRVQHVPPGTGVGYGHEFRCARASTVALVPIGYGDGLPRRLGSERGSVLVRGIPAPICGRVSMDQITIDVTDIPGVQIGDQAVLIGSQNGASQSADDLGAQADTISHEILTGLMPRVPRVYVSGGTIVGTLRMASGLQSQPSGRPCAPDQE